MRQELFNQSDLMNSQQAKSAKLQELVINENSNWNLMDQEKEKIIIERDQLIDNLKHEILELQREASETHIS